MIPSTGLATDARTIDALKARAASDPKAAIKDAAKQFEALFMQELMKSMRQATMSSGMLDNAGTELAPLTTSRSLRRAASSSTPIPHT